MENKKSVMKLPAAATNYSKPNKKKNLWTPEEDLVLKRYVETHGEGNWATVSQRSGLKRGGKSCRLRWKNYLRPNIKRGDMSQEEQDLILRMHKLLGNRWSLIAGRLPGRTDNEVKNYWNTHLNKMISSCCPPGSKRKTTFHAYSNHQHHHQHNTSNKKNKIITIPNTSSTSPSRDPITINSSTAESKKDVDDQNHVRIGEPKGSITNEETTDPWNPAYILLGENHTANTAGTTTRDTFYYDDEDMIEYSPRVMHYCQFLQPSTNDVNATFGFDDEPFIGYMDSFIWV